MFIILPIKCYGLSRFLKAYAMTDEGSSISLLEENTSHILGLKEKPSDLDLQWYGEKLVISGVCFFDY